MGAARKAWDSPPIISRTTTHAQQGSNNDCSDGYDDGHCSGLSAGASTGASTIEKIAAGWRLESFKRGDWAGREALGDVGGGGGRRRQAPRPGETGAGVEQGVGEKVGDESWAKGRDCPEISAFLGRSGRCLADQTQSRRRRGRQRRARRDGRREQRRTRRLRGKSNDAVGSALALFTPKTSFRPLLPPGANRNLVYKIIARLAAASSAFPADHCVGRDNSDAVRRASFDRRPPSSATDLGTFPDVLDRPHPRKSCEPPPSPSVVFLSPALLIPGFRPAQLHLVVPSEDASLCCHHPGRTTHLEPQMAAQDAHRCTPESRTGRASVGLLTDLRPPSAVPATHSDVRLTT